MKTYFSRWMAWWVIAGLWVSGIAPLPAMTAAQVPLLPKPGVVSAIQHDLSQPLRDQPVDLQPALAPIPFESFEPFKLQQGVPADGVSRYVQGQAEPWLQSSFGDASMPTPIRSWDGINNRNGAVPPDTDGDVGPNHYMQWVNLSFQIWDKQGTSLYGPANGNVMWSGLGGYCQSANDGDPIVLYDPLADRWFVSQFALPGYPYGPFYQCIAVSQTPDPTGAWYRYAYLWSNTKMNDYPKFGVWPDGYYMSVNQFNSSGFGAGVGVAVFEREKMLQGLDARMVTFDLNATNPNFQSMLPADLDGKQSPPIGAPNVFVEWDDGTWLGGSDALRTWDFHVDWSNTSLSTFGLTQQPNQIIPTVDLDPGNISNTYWITQPNTTRKLDSINDRLMYRIQYRNFGGYEVLVGNHTVDATHASQAGIYWFELRKTGANPWSLYQQGVYSPDTSHRWMGSIAMDGAGNIGLGFSLASSTTFPSVAYTGRLAGDTLGTLPQGEATLQAGAGSQTGYNRWGDYSMLSVDPADECTFWYTQEYYTTTSSSGWRTRIGSFKFPTCSMSATGTLQGTVVRSSDSQPISGAQISVGGSTTFSAANGGYQLQLAPGTVSVTASAFGYQSQTNSVDISAGITTVLNFSLAAVEPVILTGNVTDEWGHPGMPLYARVDIAGLPASPLYTDPVSGQFQVSVQSGSTYNVTITADGYIPLTRPVTLPLEASTENFGLSADEAACTARGYQLQGTVCQVIPGGLLVGYVRDANNPPNLSPVTLSGAQISDAGNGNTTISGTSPSGLYFLFTSSGSRLVSAYSPGFMSLTQAVTVTLNGTMASNFDLRAGYVTAAPPSVSVSVSRQTLTTSAVVTFSNLGTVPAVFNLTEFSGTPPDVQPNGPFAPAGRRLSPRRQGELTAALVYPYVLPSASPWAGGGVLVRSWPTGLAAPWGVGLDRAGTVWISNPVPGGGDGMLYPFSLDGTPQTGTITAAGNGVFAADLAFDPLRGRMWQVNVAGDNCIYELDAIKLAATGVRICPPLGSSLRGLAYDPASDTFYGGSWNDAILYHFDRAGRLLDSALTGLNLAGLAYRPDSGHLYALSNNNSGYDVYVLDARHGYSILGGFDLPGMTNFGQAGLEFAPNGDLLAVDLAGRQVLQVTSGETPQAGLADVPWVSESLPGGTIAAAGNLPVTLNFDATGLAVGTYHAYLTVSTDTPYDNTIYKTGPILVDLTVTQGHAVELAPQAQTKLGLPGVIVKYQIMVTNPGDFAETYQVQLGAHTWAVSAPAALAELAPGLSASFEVSVTVPAAAQMGQFETLTVTVISPASPADGKQVTLTTRFGGIWVPQVHSYPGAPPVAK